MAFDLVCISYASGAGGEEIGRLVAERLGFVYVNEEIVLAAAARGGIDPGRVAEEERRKPMFAGLLDQMAVGLPLPGPPPPIDEVPSESVRELIRGAIDEVAERGHAVIAAHAASFAVSAQGPLRVLITAPLETRVARITLDAGLDESEAAKSLRRSDAGRADYLKRFHGIGEELPIHYDLVINTAHLSVEQAAALIVHASTS